MKYFGDKNNHIVSLAWHISGGDSNKSRQLLHTSTAEKLCFIVRVQNDWQITCSSNRKSGSKVRPARGLPCLADEGLAVLWALCVVHSNTLSFNAFQWLLYLIGKSKHSGKCSINSNDRANLMIYTHHFPWRQLKQDATHVEMSQNVLLPSNSWWNITPDRKHLWMSLFPGQELRKVVEASVSPKPDFNQYLTDLLMH